MARKFMNGIDLQNQRGINAADPSSATDIATKQYVDNVGAGKSWKDPARAATTATGTLASAYENGDIIDGVTLATGDRILIKNQSSGAENGIYTVNASGAPTRATDVDSTGELKAGTTVYVAEGTVNGDKEFSVTTDGTIIIGTTATTWGQTGGSGTTYSAGNGLALASTTFSVQLDSSSGLSVSGSGLKVDLAVVARKYSANIGNGASTAIAVNHALGTRDVIVSVHDAATFEEVEADVVKTDTANVTVTFASAPASNAYRVTVIG